ncbi:MAG: gpW family head-tail joining protein [Chloroflexota bacterium]
MSYTADGLHEIDRAISRLVSGERVVKITKGDQVVEYGQASLADLRAYRMNYATALANTMNHPRYFRVATSKGL